MQTFRIDFGRSWFRRLLGRHPLVRSSDRIETLVIGVAAMVVMMAIPVAASMGTAVHDSRSQVYAEQAQSRHVVIARAVTESGVTPHANSVELSAQARWNVFGTNHVEVIPVGEKINAGDRIELWVDERGDWVSAPPPPGRAGQEALGAAVLMWLSVVVVTTICVAASRRRLNRTRYAEWDRELDILYGGGRFSSGS